MTDFLSVALKNVDTYKWEKFVCYSCLQMFPLPRADEREIDDRTMFYDVDQWSM